MINRIAGVPLKRRPEAGESESAGSTFDLKDITKYVEPLENLITNNPGAAVAAAFCLGVALAWWIKRSR